MIVQNGGPVQSIAEAVLFPFDDYSIPLNKNLLMELTPARKTPYETGHGFDPEHPGKPVVVQGGPDDADSTEVVYYGSVLAVDGEYCMWYGGAGTDNIRRVCYAASKDGIEWDKPKLGILEYGGNKNNNLVGLVGDGDAKMIPAEHLAVLYEPDDPDPKRRYKMVYAGSSAAVSAAFSEDGLRWVDSPHNPIIRGSRLEHGGLVRYGNCYYMNGQGSVVPHPIKGARKRTMVTFASYDFEHWPQAALLSFRRDNIPPRPPTDFELHRGEQVHVGATLWNRGNVLIGIYGQYHNESNDRRFSTCDLGLVVSNDAMHFKEPVPDFKMVPAYEEPDGASPRLLQGQGFENIGDRSIFWYGAWRESSATENAVRVATWPKDRLAHFSPDPSSVQLRHFDSSEDFGSIVEPSHFISCPMDTEGNDAGVYLNASGLSENSYLRVEVLTREFEPIAGLSGDDCVAVTESGFRQRVTWKGQNSLGEMRSRVRLKVIWEGLRPEDAKLYAAYVG